jgi:NADH dehydrogenase [ubiquinone] 1 alpha subcomplex assembly factor 7
MEEIARVIATWGGAALIFDYGYDAWATFGETFQAMKAHAFGNVLDRPGEADLTAHVDFGALAHAAEAAGAVALGPKPQGAFLENLGIRRRAVKLARANPGQKTEIEAALDRLVAPDQMGTLFKALTIVPKDTNTPPGVT